MRTAVALFLTLALLRGAAHADFLDREGRLIYDRDYSITCHDNALFGIDWNQADALLQSPGDGKIQGFAEMGVPAGGKPGANRPGGPGHDDPETQMIHPHGREGGNTARFSGHPDDGRLSKDEARLDMRAKEKEIRRMESPVAGERSKAAHFQRSPDASREKYLLGIIGGGAFLLAFAAIAADFLTGVFAGRPKKEI